MSLTNLTRKGPSSLKDLNTTATNMNSNTIQISHKNLQFNDPQPINSLKNQASGSTRKNTYRPPVDLQSTNSNMTLGNFLSYANLNSTKSRDNKRIELKSHNLNSSNVIPEEQTGKITRFDQTITIKPKENKPLTINQSSKSTKNSTSISVKPENFCVKAVKMAYDNKIMSDDTRSPNNEMNETKDNSQAGEEQRNSVDKQFDDAEMSFKGELKSRQSSDKDSAAMSESSQKRPGSAHKKSNSGNMEFTLGVFTPEKKAPQFGVTKEKTLAPEVSRVINASYARPESTKNESAITILESREVLPSREKKNRRQDSQAGQRLLTEVEEPDAALEDDNLMAKTFKPIHSRSDENNLKEEIRKDALKQAKNLLESFHPRKELRASTQKSNGLEAEIMNLRNENMRQNEVIEILIDFVKQSKNPTTASEVLPQQPVQPSIYSNARQINFASQPTLYTEQDVAYVRKSVALPAQGYNDTKHLQKSQSSNNNKPVANIYKQSLVNHDFGLTKRLDKPAPLPLEGDTPSFATRGSRYSEDISFSNPYLSPGRHPSKLPKVNDPTGQQRVYSSPIASFLEKSTMLPSINGPRASKSGNGENNPRVIENMYQKNPAIYLPTETSELPKYDMPYNKLSNRNLGQPKPSIFASARDDPVRRSADMEISKRKSVVYGSLPMLTGVVKGPSERPDSLDMEEMKYTHDIKKPIRGSEHMTLDFSNPMMPQLPSSKNKEKILKEVFNLNWRKKPCV